MADRAMIQVEVTTWRRLQALKLGPGETFDAVIKRLLEEKRESAVTPEEVRAS